MATEHLPDFDDLPVLEGLGIRHSWEVWGPDDALGTLNLITDERVAAAARLIRSGQRISLDLPLNLPDPPLFGRGPYTHTVFPLSRNEMDDRLDGFHPQRSTQWDALNHVRCREFGYYGGRTGDPTDGPNGLGIHHLTRHGVAGRGVLIDLAGHVGVEGDNHPLGGRQFHVEDLEAALDAQGTELAPGDILCLRFGWTTAYLALDQAGRAAYAADVSHSGLDGSEEMARFLWNHHPAALCADNPAVESIPGDPSVGSLHRRVLAAQGLTLGEMFVFDELAAACRERGDWTFFFVAAPLHVPDALGSPGNAVAIL